MYLSRRQFSRVLRSLNRLSELKAFPFALICVAAQLIEIHDYKDLLEEIFDTFVTRFFGYDEARLASLKSGVTCNQVDHTATDISDGGDTGEQQCEDGRAPLPPNTHDDTLRQCWSLFSGHFIGN